VGVFSYSKEEDTAAEKLDGHLHAGVKRKRQKKLTSLLSEQATQKAQRLVGQVVQVLIEGLSPESDLLLQGRMSTQAQDIDGHVLINEIPDQADPSRYLPGQFVSVKIQETSLPYYVGTLCP
jgi:ribosomal protein S12 methylthiotransferase